MGDEVWVNLLDNRPDPVWLATGSAAGGLGRAVYIDLLGIGGAAKAALVIIVITNPEITVMAIIRIFPLPIAVGAAGI